MRIVCISDSHGSHEELALPEGDVLVHAGDFSTKGKFGDTRAFLIWFEAQPHPRKLLIAGNHDWFTERQNNLFTAMLEEYPGITYLQDSGTTIEGVKFWGSPVTPYFFGWAWNRQRGDDIKRHWDMIPEDTNVLITHGPAHMIGDFVPRDGGVYVGCSDLRERMEQLPGLKLHVYGHIHAGYGIYQTDDSPTFINASVLGEDYILTNPPIVHTLKA